ncbi:MAG: class I SAM-dependent methyltransferase [Paracoccaceae bacterium]
MTETAAPDWLADNRRAWDEKTALHLSAASYEMESVRAGRGRLYPIEEAEIGSVDGLDVLHLQCHFGRDSLILAGRGARVTGVDFSPAAIAEARRLAAGIAPATRFVEADVLRLPETLPEPAAFDLVYVTWGALCWLPDIDAWAATVAHFLRPGGRLYLAEHHPFAWVFDSAVPDGARVDVEGVRMPGWFAPYAGAHVEEAPRDYTGDKPRLTGHRTHEWAHPLGTVIAALLGRGMRLARLTEHDALPWDCYDCLVRGDDGLWRWPGRAWLPLAYSLDAVKAR